MAVDFIARGMAAKALKEAEQGGGANYDIIFDWNSNGVKSGSVLTFYNKVKNNDTSVKARIEGVLDYIGRGVLCADAVTVQIKPANETWNYDYLRVAAISYDILNDDLLHTLFYIDVHPTTEEPESDNDFEVFGDFMDLD